MKNITERLKYLINETEGGNTSKFAKKARIIPATLHNYLKGRMPNVEAIVNIRNEYKINADWLLTGQGEMTIDESPMPAIVSEPVQNQFDIETIKSVIPGFDGYLQGIEAACRIKDRNMLLGVLQSIISSLKEQDGS